MLFVENLHHGFVLCLRDLCEGLLDQGLIFSAARVEHLCEPEGSVTEQDLGVLEAPVVVAHGEVDLLRELLDLLKQSSRLGGVAGSILPDAELSHLMNHLGVDEALFAWLRLAGFCQQGVDGLLIGRNVFN